MEQLYRSLVPIWLPTTTVSSHACSSSLHQGHPAQTATLPLLRAHIRLPTPTTCGHLRSSSKQQLYQYLVTIVGCPQQRRPAIFVLRVYIDDRDTKISPAQATFDVS